MSVEAIDQFRAQVATDPGLQARLASALDVGPDALAALGKDCGYDFTAAEASAAVDRARTDGELSDFELELVAGGDAGGSGCPSTAKA